MRVFPKGQANPKRKPLPRVIASCSVVDQLVCRLFFQGFAEGESDAYPMLPTKKGLGFNRDHAHLIGEGVRIVSETLGKEPLGSDVSGWEKNFGYDEARSLTHVMGETCTNRAACENNLRNASAWWSKSLVTTPFVLDDGTLLCFFDKKGNRSGDYLTTSVNGCGRNVAATAVGNYSVEMGDDALEWSDLSAEKLIEGYRGINLPVRDVVKHSRDSFLFCSHRFQRRSDGIWVAWLETWERMLFEASYSKRNDESTCLNYEMEIAEMPEGPEKARIISFLSRRQEMLGAVAEHE